MIRIVTDTASDITVEEAKQLNVDLIPLITVFENDVFPMNSKTDYDRFYDLLKSSAKLPVTSRPSPEVYLKIYQNAKEAGDDVLVLSLSSGISSTIESAHIAKEMVGYDRVTIIDTEQAVMAQRMLVEYAVKLKNIGASITQIVENVLELRSRIKVIGIIGSLSYLRKGGRIPPAMAYIGDALGIKPVITLQDKVIQPLGKVRGLKAGIIMAYRQLEIDGIDSDFPVFFGYTSDCALGESFMKNTTEKFAIHNSKLYQVGGVIGTHLGTDSIGLAYVTRKSF